MMSYLNCWQLPSPSWPPRPRESHYWFGDGPMISRRRILHPNYHSLKWPLVIGFSNSLLRCFRHDAATSGIVMATPKGLTNHTSLFGGSLDHGLLTSRA